MFSWKKLTQQQTSKTSYRVWHLQCAHSIFLSGVQSRYGPVGKRKETVVDLFVEMIVF
jgi:hypothetical protein